ncbi:MAG: molybdopterin-guanine dinucleotide biosynthesis protein B [Deltaproteobacteria bacterium]|jgi:molybdopterin-guanine dinucleotide biosynthesis protein B|nr:molybdopterin-guanine dinucleotide biosynthesis protein B [Deltaproteobacteria bacterium]
MQTKCTARPEKAAQIGKAGKKGKRPVVVAVSGVKNSGKTTLIEGMLPHLAAAGLRVAVIKHDGHSFPADPPGTDTGRFMAAGALGAAIFDGAKFKLVKHGQADETTLIAQFPEADLILLEGFKHSSWPKLELVRAGNSVAPVCDPATLLALVTDLSTDLPGVPGLPLGDAAGAAKTILDYVNSFRC